MLRFVMTHDKKIVFGSGLTTRGAMASSFEVKTVVQRYQQYKTVWDAQVGYNTMLSSSFSNHSLLFLSVLSILAPLFAVV